LKGNRIAQSSLSHLKTTRRVTIISAALPLETARPACYS